MWPMRATIGRPALRCVCKRRRASMIDRRHFLIGAGALLTASFVRRASAFSKKTGRPLILPAVQEPEERFTSIGKPTARSPIGACHSGRISHSRRRFRPGGSICAALGTPSGLMTRSGAPAESMICPSMISTPALTASGGKTDGTTSPDPRPRRTSCSKASIWITQDQRLGKPARSSWRCTHRRRMRTQQLAKESDRPCRP